MFSASKKRWAHVLWSQGVTGKEIARRVGTSESTISLLKRDEGWEKDGREFVVEYRDVIQNSLQIIGLLQLEVLEKKARDCTEEIRNIKFTANTVESMERLKFEVGIREELLSLEKHMEWLKTQKPFPQSALDLAQKQYDELREKLE